MVGRYKGPRYSGTEARPPNRPSATLAVRICPPRRVGSGSVSPSTPPPACISTGRQPPPLPGTKSPNSHRPVTPVQLISCGINGQRGMTSPSQLSPDAFPAWALLNDVVFSGVKLQQTEDRGFGLVADGDLGASESNASPLMRTPQDLVLSAEAVDEYSKVDQNFKQLLEAAGREVRTGYATPYESSTPSDHILVYTQRHHAVPALPPGPLQARSLGIQGRPLHTLDRVRSILTSPCPSPLHVV